MTVMPRHISSRKETPKKFSKMGMDLDPLPNSMLPASRKGCCWAMSLLVSIADRQKTARPMKGVARAARAQRDCFSAMMKRGFRARGTENGAEETVKIQWLGQGRHRAMGGYGNKYQRE